MGHKPDERTVRALDDLHDLISEKHGTQTVPVVKI